MTPVFEKFSDVEAKRYYPQWVPVPTVANPNAGATVQNQEDHVTRYPEHYDKWINTLNPPPKSEEELYSAVLAEREACIDFVKNYPTGTLLAKDIAKDLKKSRESGVSTKSVVQSGISAPKKKVTPGLPFAPAAPADPAIDATQQNGTDKVWGE